MMTFGKKKPLKRGHKFVKYTKKIHSAFDSTLYT